MEFLTFAFGFFVGCIAFGIVQWIADFMFGSIDDGR